MTNDKFQPLPELSWAYYQNCYFQTLFDPVQTHGLYGLTENNLQQAKDWLKSLGAKRFRVVKCRSMIDRKDNGYRILCFQWPKAGATGC